MSFLGWIAVFLLVRWIFSAVSSGSAGSQTSYNRPTYQRSTTVNAEDFELYLLSLTSIIIKADGKVTQDELNYVRQHFIGMYGEQRASAIFKVFNEVVKKREVSATRICAYINARTKYDSRLQILHFLFGIANADGHLSEPELRVIHQIAGYLQLNQSDYISIKAMFVKDRDSAYKILEIDKSVPDGEVKRAYREMAKRYHPDKLMDMDEAYRKGAQEKFNAVQDAYDTIRKERGMV